MIKQTIPSHKVIQVNTGSCFEKTKYKWTNMAMQKCVHGIHKTFDLPV